MAIKDETTTSSCPIGVDRLSWLVLNTGSSSLKFGLYDAEARTELVRGAINWRGADAELTVQVGDGPGAKRKCAVADPGAAATLAIQTVLDSASDRNEIRGVGHRIVHGGIRFQESVRVDDRVEADIHQLAELAPLHNTPALAGLIAAQRALPNLPQVAVFDTSFFKDLPRSSTTLPVPRRWTDDWGIRKFGFHGISHSYCAGRAAEILGRDPGSLRLVVCHLGNGCSAAAVLGGKPVDTSMSFTPLDGLMMGTRSGSIDPGVVLHLLKAGKSDRDGIDHALNHESGLLGVSGVAGDYRQVEAAAQSGNDQARLALEIYVARLRGTIGAMAATLGGIDALVFAAGVGENSVTLRSAACDGLAFMGIRLDPAKNAAKPVDADIAAADATARVLVVHTQEELMIAREVRRVVGSG